MIELFDDSVKAERFSITSVASNVFDTIEFATYKTELEGHFTQQQTKKLLHAILRFSFYIEPVKQPKIETTKFEVRWAESLREDPRFCSYQSCLSIFRKLLIDIIQQLGHEENKSLLEIIVNHSLIAYELNLGYINRIQNAPIHTIGNVSFFWGNEIKQVYQLRQYLLNPNNHNFIEFFKETYNKIAVKSFLTDRVLTGLHKTNREKRWECHPNSVHFALRSECLLIEAKLIKQICHFDGFPSELRELLSENNVIIFSNEITKCPITLDLLSFANFHNEVLNPVMGKSSFQVGHLHPLKSLGENAFSGHTADNISWISLVGNRIQGELSADETRELILRIIENYRNAGIIN
jgi:hypothetical protein